MRPKADAAWHLHELTAGAGPGRVRAVLLRRRARSAPPGRATTRRPTRSWTRWPPAPRARGLPGLSLAWGLWARGHGRRRRRRRPRPPGPRRDDPADRRPGPGPARGRRHAPADALLVAGPAGPPPPGTATQPAPARPSGTAWPAAAPAAPPPPPTAGAAPPASPACPPPSRSSSCSTWSAPRPPPCSGTPRTGEVRPGRAFRDLGFDSLTAVELRNRLRHGHRAAAARHAGVRLPHPGGAGRVAARRSSLAVRAAGAEPVAGRGRGRRASRSRSWGWAAGSPAGCATRRTCGSCWPAGTDAISGFPADRGWD